MNAKQFSTGTDHVCGAVDRRAAPTGQVGRGYDPLASLAIIGYALSRKARAFRRD